VVSRGVGTLALVIGANLLLVILALVLDPRVDGPAGSSIVTTDGGYGAWHDTLAELGIPATRMRVPLDEADVAAGAVLVIAAPDPELVDGGYRRALDGLLDRGGRVILVGEGAVDLLGPLAPSVASGAEDGLTVVTSPVGDVTELVLDGEWLPDPGGGEVLVADPQGRARVAEVRPGAVVVAGVSVFENRVIGQADNGVLAVRLVGPGPVVFDEYVHGFGAGQGLGAVRPVVVVLAGLAMAAVVWMWAVGARFGPPEQRMRALPPPRGDYLDGVAVSLARAAPDEGGYGMLRRRGRERLDRLAGRYSALPPDGRRRAAAAEVGVTDEELDALHRPVESKEDAIRVASATAKIERG
jgi:hypothetical protein